jgi:uncharacterized membrane protein YjgN (DUF898 family)
MDQVLGRDPDQAAPLIPEPVIFNGRGSEYFKIWIVNLLLTIVTVGIYSAWAKVRRLQYFYRNTEIAGSSFDFHGNPVRILIGRIIALVLYAAYYFAQRQQSLVMFAIVAVLSLLIMPWLLRNSLRFRLYNTSWRGTRFHFRGSLGRIYGIVLLNLFLAVAGICIAVVIIGFESKFFGPARANFGWMRFFSVFGLILLFLYLWIPFAHQQLKAYQHGNSWFGRTKFSFHASVWSFYLNYLVSLAAILAMALLFKLPMVSAFLAHLRLPTQPGDLGSAMRLVAVLWIVFIIVGLSVGQVFRAFLTNLIWSNTRLGEHRIDCVISPWGLIWVAASNFVLTIVTLGFFYPWAAVRLARFQMDSVDIFRASDLQEFEEAEQEDIGALGEEASTIFDFDIAL